MVYDNTQPVLKTLFAMRKKLFFLSIFLAVANTVSAQCNTKEYKRIFAAAVALREQGLFIDAKNTFEAAKIFACSKTDVQLADDNIDALFKQIDRLREEANTARLRADSAFQKAAAVLDKIYFYQGNFGLAYASQQTCQDANGDRAKQHPRFQRYYPYLCPHPTHTNLTQYPCAPCYPLLYLFSSSA
jgi:hypothetical protein